MDVWCPRTRKLALPQFEAHNLMEKLRPTDPRQDLLEVYDCDGGGLGQHFHVGHRDVGGRARPDQPTRPPIPLHRTLGDHMPEHLLAMVGGQQ